jgi:NTE family protein
MGLRTELLQPVDLERRWLGSVYLDARRRIDTLFIDQDAVATYRNSVLRAGVGMRSRYFTDSEILLGVQRSWYDQRRESGLDLGDTTGAGTAGILRYTIDRLDDWDFPRGGLYATLSLEQAFRVIDSDLEYRKGSLELQQAFGRDRHSVSLAARFGTAFGSDLPLVEAFPLGGFQNLSGFADRQFLSNRSAFGRTVYAYQLMGGGALAKAFYLGGSVEAGRVSEQLNVFTPRAARVAVEDRWVGAGSLFLSADTALGPLYLAVGFGEGGRKAYYLFLGRP